jgi:hypothetical protein
MQKWRGITWHWSPYVQRKHHYALHGAGGTETAKVHGRDTATDPAPAALEMRFAPKSI